MIRIGLFEVSHWHFERYYLPSLRRPDLAIVGISDRNFLVREAISHELRCAAFEEWRTLVSTQPMDFAFVFGRHAEMPEIAAALVAIGVPFAIEKPAGRSSIDIRKLRHAAESKGNGPSVAFAYRNSPLAELLSTYFGGGRSPAMHISIRNFAGSPERYLERNCGWMLSKEDTGGGCTMNVSIHFIDLVRWLIGREAISVRAKTSNRFYDSEVEDHSTLILEMDGGCVATIETGYSFPVVGREAQEFSICVASKDVFLKSTDKGLRVFEKSKGSWSDIPLVRDERMYGTFVEQCLATITAGGPPLASLLDAEEAVRIIEAAYLSSSSDKEVRL